MARWNRTVYGTFHRMRIALLALFLATPLVASSVDTRLAQEIDRLDGVLRSLDTPELDKDARPMLEGNRALLNRARAATSPSVRVYRLRDAAVGIETLRYIIRHKADEKSLVRVQTLAKASRASIEKPLAPMNGPALQIALRQIAATRAQKLLRASVPFARAASPANGLFYLGEAEGNRKYRDFVESLPLGSVSEPRPNAAAIDAALVTLDTAALAAFEKDPAGRAAVGLSANLKEARQLAERDMLEGAALMMTEAQRRARVKVPKAVRSDSIAAMWQAEEGGRDVLPLYASLFAAAPAQAKIAKNVTVTLVRWPYT